MLVADHPLPFDCFHKLLVFAMIVLVAILIDARAEEVLLNAMRPHPQVLRIYALVAKPIILYKYGSRNGVNPIPYNVRLLSKERIHK